jgi:ribosome assembly protein YihI (activator of Der GTPase)
MEKKAQNKKKKKRTKHSGLPTGSSPHINGSKKFINQQNFKHYGQGFPI